MKYQRLLAALAVGAFLASAAPASASHTTTRTRSTETFTSSRNLSSSAQRKVRELQRMSKLAVIPVPILLGVAPGDFGDTWGDARSGGRTHEGTDILAPRGEYVVAPAESVVTQIGVGANGGNFVYTTNPGGERFYFAHLDAYADGLRVGDILEKGDLIGYVGNTGNASGGATHLHFGIYDRGATNPYPRLKTEFTTRERLSAVQRIVKAADDEDAEARVVVGNHGAFFRQALAAGETLPPEIASALAAAVLAPPVASGGAGTAGDLTLGSRGAGVVRLQAALIAQDKGPAAKALAAAGATGNFGPVTQAALVEYQKATGISPASGYFGPITRARMSAAGLL